MDESWRKAERAWEASPDDQALLRRAIEARRRAGVGVPGRMLERELFPPRKFESKLVLTVEAEPGARRPRPPQRRS